MNNADKGHTRIQPRIKKAVALKWNDQLPAPLVTAKGEGRLAEAMIRLAEKNGIEIIKEETLPELLFEGNIMDFIPFELYEAVAKILSTVYNLKDTDYGQE